MCPGESKSSPRRIQAKLRQQQALQMRLAGASFEAIAEQLGYKSKSGAHKAVRASLGSLGKPEAMEYKLVNLVRIDRLLLAFWQKAIGGDMRAARLCLDFIKALCELTGANEPERKDITVWVKERAAELGLDPQEAVREAERIVKELEG